MSFSINTYRLVAVHVFEPATWTALVRLFKKFLYESYIVNISAVTPVLLLHIAVVSLVS